MFRPRVILGVLVVALVALMATVSSAHAALVAQWKFDGNLNDQTGNHNATVAGGGAGFPSYTAGRDGTPNGALVLDGSNDCLTTNSDSNGLGMGGDFTAMGWIYADTLGGDKTIFGKDAGGGNNQLHLITRDDRAHLGFFGNDEGGDQQLSTGKWIHVAWSYDSSIGSDVQSIFVNGARDVAGSGHGALGNGGGNVLIGRWADDRYFDGNLDDLVIVDQALAENQVQYVMNGGDPASLPAADPTQAQNSLSRINPTNGHYYDLVRGDVTWDEARVLAAQGGIGGAQGHLATISDAAENGFVRTLEGNFDKWIGFTDSDQTSSIDSVTMGGTEFGNTSGQPYPPGGNRGRGWVWVTGEPVTFAQNWGAGEPNDAGGEDAAHIRGDGFWNDHRAGSTLGQTDQRLSYVVEYDTANRSDQGTFDVRVVNGATGIGNPTDLENFLNANPGGVRGLYYAIDFVDPDLYSSQRFTGGAPFPNDAPGDQDSFALEATGLIMINEADTYTFGVDRDDVFRLYIDGSVLMEGGCCGETYQNTFLSAGMHDIRFLFSEGGGHAHVELFAARGSFSGWDPQAFRIVGDWRNGGILVMAPEPATILIWTLLAGVAIGLGRRRRKR